MSRKLKRNSSFFLIGVVVLGAIIFLANFNSGPGELDTFAQCLEEKGAVFYGAFWCPHCQAQKAIFGKSQKHLPYVECSTANGKGQISYCNERGITGYPTWEFADGSREPGELSLETLAEKTGCSLSETDIF